MPLPILPILLVVVDVVVDNVVYNVPVSELGEVGEKALEQVACTRISAVTDRTRRLPK
jgi:hypothetical protein